MLGTSLPELIFVRVGTLALHSITPLSITCAVLPVITSIIWPWPLQAYFAAETLFYLFWYLPWKRRLEQPAIHPPQRPKAERQALVRKCLACVKAPDRYLSGWFHGAALGDIYKDNLGEFLAWAFLDRDQLPARGSEEAHEVEEYVRQFEAALGRELPLGYNKNVRSLRLTLDPVKMTHRSLAWYCIVGFIDAMTALRFRLYGLTLVSTKHWFQSFPVRPHALLVQSVQRSPSKDFSYWYRPHTAEGKVPVVFLHGLGIGLHPYVEFLHEVASEAGDGVGIIVIEIMPISMRICGAPTRPAEFAGQMLQILEYHGIEKFVLVAHSYGTVLSTHLLHCPDISPRIDSMVLIDPITFMLHLPSVAYNFTCRRPVTANQVQLDYFASKDPGISHTICRHFFWRQNIMWKEELRGRKCVVALAGRDLLVDSREVWEYLTGEEMTRADEAVVVFRKREEEGNRNELTVMWHGRYDHAQVFERRERREMLVRTVAEFANTPSERTS